MVKSVRALLLEHILYKNNNKQLVPIILHNSKENKYKMPQTKYTLMV